MGAVSLVQKILKEVGGPGWSLRSNYLSIQETPGRPVRFLSDPIVVEDFLPKRALIHGCGVDTYREGATFRLQDREYGGPRRQSGNSSRIVSSFELLG